MKKNLTLIILLLPFIPRANYEFRSKDLPVSGLVFCNGTDSGYAGAYLLQGVKPKHGIYFRCPELTKMTHFGIRIVQELVLLLNQPALNIAAMIVNAKPMSTSRRLFKAFLSMVLASYGIGVFRLTSARMFVSRSFH